MQVDYTSNESKLVIVAPISQIQQKELVHDMKASGPISLTELNQKLEDYSSVYGCKPFFLYKLSLYKVSFIVHI